MAKAVKKGLFCPSCVRKNWLLLSTVVAVLADDFPANFKFGWTMPISLQICSEESYYLGIPPSYL